MIRSIVIFFIRVFFKLFYHHHVYGREHFPNGGGLIAPNHVSYLDPPVLGISCPAVVHFLAKDGLYAFKPFGWFLRRLSTHPVKRGKGNVGAFRTAMALIRNGKKVVIFPEGRRSADGVLQRGQLGVGMLVQRTHCRVIPVYIHGTYDIWKRKQRYPRLRGKTACVFGRPIDFSDLLEGDKKEGQKEIVERIMTKIALLRDWYLAGAKGSPP